MKHIAITGASGFVGSHVLDVLLDQLPQDVKITALVKSSSVIHRTETRLTLVQCDLHGSERNLYTKIGSPDALMHLAWAGLPNYDNPRHFEYELPHQYAFLKAMIEDGLPKLLVTGTCFEYGAVNGALSVSTACGPPTNAYAYAKRCLHQQLLFLQKVHPLVLQWARLFYMYGGRQRYGSLYSSLKKALENGDESFPMSMGEQLRDFLPVEEVAKQLVEFVINSDKSEVKNICAGVPVSVRSIAEKWCKDNGWDIKLKFGEIAYAKHEPMAFWGSLN
jgi:nucleoside-diphosphate-sugar epimerase